MSISVNITNDGHNLIRDSAHGIDRFIITHFELGSSNTAVGAADHHLYDPKYRRAVTSFVNGGAIGEILISVYVPGGDAVGIDVQEGGIYGGNAANSGIGTGVLIARFLWVPSTNPKTALVSFQETLDLFC